MHYRAAPSPPEEVRGQQNKKPEPQSLDSNHGTGTNQKNERMLYIIAKVKNNDKKRII